MGKDQGSIHIGREVGFDLFDRFGAGEPADIHTGNRYTLICLAFMADGVERETDDGSSENNRDQSGHGVEFTTEST